MWILLALLAVAAPARAAEAPAGLLFAAHFDANSDADWGRGDRLSHPLVRSAEGGRFGKALDLEGRRTVGFAAAGNLNPAEGALEMWVCPRWAGDDGVAHTFFDASWGQGQWLRVNKIAANAVGIATAAGDTGTYRRVDGDVSAWKPGEWHHLAAAWGGGKLRFWIDGTAVPRARDDAPAPQGMPETFTLGGDALIDEVRIWGTYRETFDRQAAVAHPALPPVERRPPGIPPPGELDRFTFTLSGARDGLLVAAKAPEDDLDPAAAPPAARVGAPLDTFSPPGEVEPVAFVLYAGRDLKSVRVTPGELKCPAGAIPAGQIEVRLAVRSLMRRLYTLPPKESVPVSRFLRRNQAFDLPAGTFREVVATVRVPDDVRAGAYQGSIRVEAEGLPAREVPLRLEVLPFRLPETPRKRYGCYYQFPELPAGKEQAELELRDIRAHGGTILYPHLSIRYRKDGDLIVPSYDEIRAGLDLMRAAGFHGPVPIVTGCQSLPALLGLPADWVDQGPEGEGQRRLNAVAKPALEGLLRLFAGYPEFQPLATHMDEVFGKGRLPLYLALTRAVRQVPALPVYITLHNRPTPEVEAMTKQIEPFMDVRCYNGHSLDEWLKAGHTWAEMAADLKRTGDDAWTYYNPRGSFVTPKWFRVVNGLYLWGSPLSAHVVWTYHSIGGDPFDDNDEQHPEMGFAFPSDEDGITPVPTRHWEAFREGAEDARFLCYLEDLAAKAKQRDPAAARSAEAWLAEVRAILPKPAELQAIDEESPVLVAVSRRFDGAGLQRLRRRTVDEILKLLPAVQ